MTIPKASDKVPSSQPKFTCVNCGDNLGDSSRVVHAFQTFINNAPARIFVEAAIKEIYRLNDQPDFEFQDDCVLCVHCCLLLSQMFGLFRLFEARQNPEGLLASCCSAFSNGATERGNAELMEVYVTENEAVDGEGHSQVSFHRVDSADDDDFEGYQSSEGMEENADQMSYAADSPPGHPDNSEDDRSKSEAEDVRESENTKTETLSLKDVEQRELLLSKICPDRKQLIFQCADCSEHFKQAVQLRAHRLSAHDSREAYKCAVCKNVSPSETIFRRHLFEHLKVTKNKSDIKCSLCDQRFPNRPTLAKHKSLMHSSGLKKKLKKSMKANKSDESTKCEICDKNFDNIFLLRKHKLVAHVLAQRPTSRDGPEVPSGLELGIDAEIGNNENVNKDEEADVQEPADPDYIPNADHSSSESGSEEEEAEDEEEEGEDEEEEGEDVDEASKYQLKKLRPNSREKVLLTCGDCMKQFKHRQAFVCHRKTEHPGNPIYQCCICQLIFQGSTLLLRHVVEQHNSDSQPQSEVTFKCTDCNLTYHSVTTLGKHRKDDHGDVERPFKCHLCPVAFKQPQGLRNHILFGHSGAPVPKCKDCDKTFYDYRGLRLHMKQQHHIALMTRGNCTIPETYDKMMFMCVKCNNEEFSNEDAYLEHNKNVHSQEIFKCLECLKWYTTEYWFNKHLESHKKSPNACDVCEATFPNSWDLKRHMTYEHTEQPTVAPDEDPPSTQDKNGMDDIEINQDPTTELFGCPQCSLQFATIRACRFHFSEVHPELMNFECEICNKKYRTVELLKSHRRHQHRTVKCEYCDFVSSVSSVRYHCKNAHISLVENRKQSQFDAQHRLKEEKEAMKRAISKSHLFKCADCDETFTVLGKLINHRTEAHPDEEKLKCPYCFNVSPTLASLKGHMLNHDESKDWPCGECSLRFILKLTRNKHLDEVHGIHKTKEDALPLPPEWALKHLSGEVSKTEKPMPTGTQKYKCPECDEEFNWASNLGNHRVIVHGVSPSERFKCYHCSSISASLLTYKMHLERHGEKNHLCSECGKSFTTRDYLKQHIGLMHDKAAGARLRAKYKRSREKKKGQQVKESKSTVEVTVDESNMEF